MVITTFIDSDITFGPLKVWDAALLSDLDGFYVVSTGCRSDAFRHTHICTKAIPAAERFIMWGCRDQHDWRGSCFMFQNLSEQEPRLVVRHHASFITVMGDDVLDAQRAVPEGKWAILLPCTPHCLFTFMIISLHISEMGYSWLYIHVKLIENKWKQKRSVSSGPAQAFFLVNVGVLLFGGQAQGFCKAPRHHFSWSRRYINKDELNSNHTYILLITHMPSLAGKQPFQHHVQCCLCVICTCKCPFHVR